MRLTMKRISVKEPQVLCQKMRLTVRRISGFDADPSGKDDFLNNYEQRKQARIDRLHEKEDKARAQSSALSKQSEDMASVILAGQLIHGAPDRRYRDRIMGKVEQSFAASDKADYYERRRRRTTPPFPPTTRRPPLN